MSPLQAISGFARVPAALPICSTPFVVTEKCFSQPPCVGVTTHSIPRGLRNTSRRAPHCPESTRPMVRDPTCKGSRHWQTRRVRGPGGGSGIKGTGSRHAARHVGTHAGPEQQQCVSGWGLQSQRSKDCHTTEMGAPPTKSAAIAKQRQKHTRCTTPHNLVTSDVVLNAPVSD